MNDKKIILLKSHLYKTGGLEKYAWHAAHAFAHRGFEVHLLTTGKKGTLVPHSNIELHFFDVGYGPNFMRIDQFDRYCLYWQEKFPAPFILGMDRNSQQTHIRAGNGSHLAYLKRRELFEPYFKKFSFAINPLHRKILEIERKGFENPSLQKLITNSSMVKEEIIAYYDIDPKKIEVLYNGVEWEVMAKDFDSWEEERQLFLQTLNLDPSAHYFLFVGNGFKRKGLKQLLRALKEFNKEHFHLLVLGQDKKMNEYMRLAKKLGLSQKVHFFGIRKDMIKFYQLADTLLIPSFYDPFANVTLEALSMGLYVVTSRSNGASEIIQEKNGTIIEDLCEASCFKAGLEKAFAHKKTSSSAQEIRTSVKQFDFSHQLNRFVDIITT